jgi:5,10-methenyltetrahydromethanopterin hydrogenase
MQSAVKAAEELRAMALQVAITDLSTEVAASIMLSWFPRNEYQPAIAGNA